MPKHRRAGFAPQSWHPLLAQVYGKTETDDQIHQRKSAAAKGQNLCLAASSAKVISGQVFDIEKPNFNTAAAKRNPVSS